jgi:hypothetical protein
VRYGGRLAARTRAAERTDRGPATVTEPCPYCSYEGPRAIELRLVGGPPTAGLAACPQCRQRSLTTEACRILNENGILTQELRARKLIP